MKRILQLAGLAFLGFAPSLPAALVVPGADGSDGSLVVSANTEIDLSQAVTGTWDQNNTANTGKGVYDASKWAVVFKYASVTVNAGATVTFKNHPSRAPVVWLVNGDVNIAGTVSLNGQDLQNAPLLAEGGPGGFRGGSASYLTGPGASAGFGIGGGGRNSNNNAGYGGVYGLAGVSAAAYGNPSLVPLVGGSGGAGDPEYNSDRRGGGGGGGAILIATSSSLALTGEVRVNGGLGKDYGNENTGGGSGGGIRIVCNAISGTGKLTAIGGGAWSTGGVGRIRVERASATGSQIISPDPSVVPLTDGSTALLWPPTGSPKVEIVSIGGSAAPADPRASFGAQGADVTLPQGTTTPVVIRTEFVEDTSQVQVRITPRSNANFTTVNATLDASATGLPEDTLQWIANVPTNVGYSALQVKVVRP